MQTENVYMEAYAKVCEPELETDDEIMDEESFYERQLESANIPDNMLYQVYVVLKEKYDKEIEDLSARYLEVGRKLRQYQEKEHQSNYLLKKDQESSLDSFAYAVFAGILGFFILDHFVFKIKVAKAMSNLTTGYGLKSLILVLPMCAVVYILSRIILRKYRMSRYLKEYEEECARLMAEYQEVGREYNYRKAILNVIKRACRNKSKCKK